MWVHALWILGLAVYAFETWRTVNRFGLRAHGALARLTTFLLPHVLLGLLLIGFFVVAWSWESSPVYGPPIGVLISVVYFVAALWKWLQTRKNDPILRD